MKNIIKWIITIIAFVLSIVVTISIHNLNIIPNKYIIIGSIILLILNTIANLLLFTKKIIPKIFSVIIYILIIVIAVFGIHFAYTTNNFLDQAFSNTEKQFSLKYYILSKNEYKESELNNKDIHYLNNIGYVNDAIQKINEKFIVNMIPLEDPEEVIKNDVFLIDETTIDLLEDSNKIKMSDYHIIYTIDLNYTIEENTPVNTDAKNKHYYNIFVGGYDFSGYRMDMNKIVTINTETNEVLITNIHRFAYLEVPGYGKRDTLSSMGSYGINNNIAALEELLDIKFDYYLVAYATSLPTLIDDIGGIEYCSDKEYTTYHTTTLDYKDDKGYKVHVKKGCQQLNGIEALTVAREREAFYWGAVERDNNTTEIMIDILDAMKKPSNLSNYTTILNDVNGLYVTSIPRDVITNSSKKILNSKLTITKQTIDGKNGTNKIHFSNTTGAVQYVYDSSKNEASAKIKALDK